MKLTNEINQALSRIQSEDHINHSGLRQSLMDSVAPVFDKDDGGAYFPLRPSGCLKPLRDLYYDLQNFYNPGSVPKADFEPRVKLIFQFGHLTETLLKKLCTYNFDVAFDQQRVKYGELIDKDGTTIPLTGAIDWAMRLDTASSKLTLCDAKSIADYGFKQAPKEENIAQMQLYMHSDWGRANEVNSAILLYFNKNTSDMKCIEIEYDPALAAKIFSRLEYVWECYKKNELPPREYLAGIDWKADYSPYIEFDNGEFTVAPELRTTVEVQEYFKAARYAKDDIRNHVEKYGNRVANYLDKQIYIVYTDKKLQLIVNS